MNSMMISIIIPIYNVEAYLSQCIESVCSQTYRNLEIILVDDGSTDLCPQICDEFACRDSRIVVIHKKNEGLVKARKDGIQAAHGFYIGYVDGDDWIEPNMFERLYETLTVEDVDVVMCGHYEDTEETHRIVYHGISEGKYDKNALKNFVYPNMIVNGEFFEWGVFPGVWDKLFKREYLEKYQMAVSDEITMGEDAACIYPSLLNVNRIFILKECLYHYRQTPSSMIKKDIDARLQKKQFRILYHSVLDSFQQYTDIYDLTKQWKEYILFLMVPRAEVLYDGIEKLDYLFPFPNVKRGSDIILYGMGTYGQCLYKYIKRTRFCNILACVDRNYIELRKQGMRVESPDDIEKYEYDAIVIANSFAKVRSEIYRNFVEKYPVEKIHVMDEELIKSDVVQRAFGLD